MLYRRMAALAVASSLILALPAVADNHMVNSGAGSSPVGQAGGKTKTTEYVIGFKKGVQPPFNKVVLATYPPGTDWTVINKFVAKEKKTGLYSSVIVTTALPPA
jgi:hypothetical protein